MTRTIRFRTGETTITTLETTRHEAKLDEERTLGSTTFLSAMGKYWGASLLVVSLFVLVGVGLARAIIPEYQTSAEVIVQDPRATTILDAVSQEQRSTISSERYLADQVAILESAQVAQVASEMLDGALEPAEILDNRDIIGSTTSNLIEVRFSADSPEMAKDGADALVEAYLDVANRQAEEAASLALARLDAQQEAVEADLAEIEAEIQELTAGSEAMQELRAQMESSVVALNELRLQRDAAAPGSEQRALLNSEINELVRDFESWEAILRIEQSTTELGILEQRQQAVIAERADLRSLRSSIATEAELNSIGVLLVSPARVPTSEVGASTVIVVALMAVLGVFAAAVVAYSRSMRE